MNEEILRLLGLPAEEIARYRQQATMSGLGALGQALIQAGAPRQGPRQGTLAGIAQALPAYGAGRQASMDQVLQDLLRKQQAQQMVAQQQAQQQAQKRQETALARLRSITQPVTPESALGMPGRVGPTADRAAMIGQRPQMTRDLALQLGLDPDLPEPLRKSLFDYAQATKPEEAKVAPGIVGEYQAAVAAGLVPPRTTLPQYVEMKKPPGTTVNVPVNLSTEKKFGEAFATQVAQEDVKLREAALSAPSQLDTIQQSRNLLEQGKVFTGAFANQKLRLAAAGQALGVTGKDTDEIVSNTQRLFANRAKATLDNVRASGLGAGQGFTDKDRDFLEKAVLGNIEFTSEALKRQLEIEERVARGAVTKWNNRIKQLPKSTVEATGITPVDITAPQTSRVRRYNPATGKVE